MDNQNIQKIVREILDLNRWRQILSRFSDVLHMNIFMVDHEGRLLIPVFSSGGDRVRFGARLLSRSFRLDLTSKRVNLLKEFQSEGEFLVSRDPFDFHLFAVPVRVDKDTVVAYLVVGPVSMHKKWDSSDYLNVAGQIHISEEDDFLDIIHEVRVITHVSMKAILELLAEISREAVNLKLERRFLQEQAEGRNLSSQQVSDDAEKIFSQIHLDEMLVTVLDIALSMAKADAGSVMVLDNKSGQMTIRAARGLDKSTMVRSATRFGESVAGVAAQKNRSFVIRGKEGGADIEAFLNRSDIKSSAVVPLACQNRVWGVMNLSSYQDAAAFDDIIPNLTNLTRLLSSAVLSDSLIKNS